MPKTSLSDNKPRPSTRDRMEAYLRELAKADRPSRAVAEEQGVDVLALARWLDQPWFSDRIAEMRRHLRHRREVDLERAAVRAVELLHAAVLGESPLEPPARGACAELIRLSRDTTWRRRAAKPRAAAAEVPASLAHADVPSDEAERLMAELEGAVPK